MWVKLLTDERCPILRWFGLFQFVNVTRIFGTTFIICGPKWPKIT
jgi:hypothetical protein